MKLFYLVIVVLIFIMYPVASKRLKRGRFIAELRLRDGETDVNATAHSIGQLHRLEVIHTYPSLNAFSFQRRGMKFDDDTLGPFANLMLRRDERIGQIFVDEFVETQMLDRLSGEDDDDDDEEEISSLVNEQVIPTGLARIVSLHDPVSHLSLSSIGVAVIDTGIETSHSDIDITDGYSCVGRSKNYDDANGHGTHVAGIIAATNNSIGVVGVAPTVNLFAVRVLNKRGEGTISDVICGLEWVLAHQDEVDVVNLSLGAASSSRGKCGPGAECTCNDPFHKAICLVHQAGITVIAAAGNAASNARSTAPACFDETISVSALADFDGLPGALGRFTCRIDEDDTLADFSNYGGYVDIAAPGVCIQSLWKSSRRDDGYKIASGTSMAAPFVTGAATLALALHPEMTPDEVKQFLVVEGNFGYDDDSQDNTQEPLLNIDFSYS